MTLAKRLANADFLGGSFLLAFSLFWIALSLQFPGGTQDGVPGCGVFPIIMSVVLGTMSLALLIRGFRLPAVFFGFSGMARANILAVLGSIVAFAAFLFIWYYLNNFIVASVIMMMALGALYRMHWLGTLIFSVLFSATIYYVFGKFLMILLELR